MRKFKLFLLMLISMSLLTTNVYADSTNFNATWTSDEFLYTGSEIIYKPEINVDHVQVEYIESTGTQAIDTDVKASSDNGFEIDVVLLTNAVWAHIIGGAHAWDSKWHNGIIFNGVNTSNTAELTINDSTHPTPLYNVKYSGFLPNTRYTVSFVNHQFNIEGLFTSPIDLTGKNAPAMYDWYLFGTNDHDATISSPSKIRLYGCKMYEGTTVVRNYIPVVVTKEQPKEKNSDGTNPIPVGTVCLYDIINGIYYLNIGTGNFIPGIKLNGETYKVLESITSSGSTYFDTNYNATINTKWILEYKFNSITGPHVGGGLNDDTKRFCLVNDNSINPKFLFGIGNIGTTSINVNTNKHIFVLDGPNKRGLIDGKVEATTTSSTVSNTRLFIFARNDFITTSKHVANLYNSKIFENNNLIKNYIPVKKDSDSKVGIYDLKNNVFLLDSSNNSFTAGNYDAYIGDDFYRVDKKTDAGEYITYPFSNLATALYSGDASAFDRTWIINKVKITPSFIAYNGVFNNLEHPFSFVEAKNQNGEVVDSSKFTIKYYTDDTYSTELNITDINTDHGNFKDIQTFTFCYKLEPIDTTNHEGSQGPITIKVYKQTPSTPRYVVPNTSVY